MLQYPHIHTMSAKRDENFLSMAPDSTRSNRWHKSSLAMIIIIISSSSSSSIYSINKQVVCWWAGTHFKLKAKREWAPTSQA